MTHTTAIEDCFNLQERPSHTRNSGPSPTIAFCVRRLKVHTQRYTPIAAALIALCLPSAAHAQACYEFKSGTAVDLQFKMVTPIAAAGYSIVTPDPNGKTVAYSYSPFGESMSLAVGTASITETLQLPLTINTSSYVPNGNVAYQPSNSLSMLTSLDNINLPLNIMSEYVRQAGVQLGNQSGVFFPNGLPPAIPAIANWAGQTAVINLLIKYPLNGNKSATSTYPITAIVNCNPTAVALASGALIPSGASAAGISPMAAAADFNGDGFPDLATTNLVDNTVSILFGTGKGTFQAPVKYATGNGTYGIVARDFDGDGKPDLAVVNGADNTVSILLNNGAGVFPAHPSFSYQAGTAPFGIATADLNGDGFLDLVVTNSSDNTLSVLLGKGNGSFQSQVAYATGSYPFGTVVADVNNDGFPDLVVWNQSDSTVGVLLNDKTGKFTPQVAYATGSSPFSVSVGDFNGDGYPDLAVANLGSNSVSILINDTTGKFFPAVSYATGVLPTSVLAQDFNADGIPDLAVTNLSDGTLSLLLGKGDGTFMPQTAYAAGIQPYGLVSADFNGDGKPDLAITSFFASTVGVMLQTSSPITAGRVIGIPLQTGPPSKSAPNP